jgi:hypothetical protein
MKRRPKDWIDNVIASLPAPRANNFVASFDWRARLSRARSLAARQDTSHQRPWHISNRTLNLINRSGTHDLEAICHLAAKCNHKFVLRIIENAAIEIKTQVARMGQFNSCPHQQTDRAEMRYVSVTCRKEIVEVLVIPDEEYLRVHDPA